MEQPLFTNIVEPKDYQERYDLFKYQIKKNKHVQFKYDQEYSTLSGKRSGLNPSNITKQKSEVKSMNQFTVDVHKHSLKRKVKQIYLCPICQVKKKTSQSVRAHLKMSHDIFLALSCPQCDFLENNARNLARHIKNQHIEQVNYSVGKYSYHCSLSGKSFLTMRQFQEHIASDQGYIISLQQIEGQDNKL